LIVHRRPRPSLKAFARMLMTYGRGRAEQFRSYPTLGSLINFVPPAFCLYLLSLVLVPIIGPLWLLPLALYFFIVLIDAGSLAISGGILRAIGAIPLITLTHILYGVGFWRGLFTKLRRPGERAPTEVVIERVPGEKSENAREK